MQARKSGGNADEFFDVVNDRDEVIGCRPRREIHRLGLLHRAAHVLVFNARGELFLQKRSMTKDRQPGLWDSSASGHLDAGETYPAAAARELKEEIGLQPPLPLEFLFQLPASAETDNEFVHVFRCRSEGPFALHPEEIECGAWFDPERLHAWTAQKPGEFASAFLLIWRRLNEPANPPRVPQGEEGSPPDPGKTERVPRRPPV
jgi:16S rRNA (adenine1518-N6/adenine1519-N6)-dimethyltransferase